jgi:hypothetical protein
MAESNKDNSGLSEKTAFKWAMGLGVGALTALFVVFVLPILIFAIMFIAIMYMGMTGMPV